MNARMIVGLATVVVLLLAAGAARADVFHMGTGLTSLDMVTVGDPGNAADVNLDRNNNPLGSVGYTYKMGTYDVTAAQYCQFLNAVATQSDQYSLYNPAMAGGPGYYGCGITRTGSPGNYSYNTTSSGYVVNNGNFPVNYVSWGDAARFCNWLTNGQQAQTTETGSYTLNEDLMAVTRNSNAKYVIPTVNEWYKAAYYKGNSTNAGYWVYPTQSNIMPSNVLSSTGTNNANVRTNSWTDPTNGLTVVGAFADSPGAYGTYDMGGDVWQMNEEITAGVARGLRGSSWNDLYSYLDQKASVQGNIYPSTENEEYGFRVSEVPEPASMAVLALGGIGMLLKRRGR